MGQTASTSQHQTLDLPPEQALFSSLDGLVATFHTNERPLQGLSGLLDWYFHGAISSYLRAGAVRGEKGECAYLPLKTSQEPGARVFHILLIGAGQSSAPGTRQALDESSFTLLRKNIASLKVPKIGVSRADFGNASKESISQHLREVPLWIVR